MQRTSAIATITSHQLHGPVQFLQFSLWPPSFQGSSFPLWYSWWSYLLASAATAGERTGNKGTQGTRFYMSLSFSIPASYHSLHPSLALFSSSPLFPLPHLYPIVFSPLFLTSPSFHPSPDYRLTIGFTNNLPLEMSVRTHASHFNSQHYQQIFCNYLIQYQDLKMGEPIGEGKQLLDNGVYSFSWLHGVLILEWPP